MVLRRAILHENPRTLGPAIDKPWVWRKKNPSSNPPSQWTCDVEEGNISDLRYVFQASAKDPKPREISSVCEINVLIRPEINDVPVLSKKRISHGRRTNEVVRMLMREEVLIKAKILTDCASIPQHAVLVRYSSTTSSTVQQHRVTRGALKSPR